MSYTTERSAVRTVKNGRVKIGGKYFAPHDYHLAYDDRLEGMRLLFGRYVRGYTIGEGYLFDNKVCLIWSSHEYPAPSVVIDGKIHWQSWREVTHD